MNQKGIGWAGAILIFIAGSLAFTYAINPQFREKVNNAFDSFGGSSALSPEEIRNHPEKYMGENVTVEGWYSYKALFPEKNPETRGEAVEIIQGMLRLRASNYDQFLEGGKYRVTGIVRRSNPQEYIFEPPDLPVLVVLKVEPA